MGLFKKFGRQVEQFKTKVVDAAEEDAVTQCNACGARFSEQYERCPECDSKIMNQKTAQE